jgi:hypothetical protein
MSAATGTGRPDDVTLAAMCTTDKRSLQLVAKATGLVAKFKYKLRCTIYIPFGSKTRDTGLLVLLHCEF